MALYIFFLRHVFYRVFRLFIGGGRHPRTRPIGKPTRSGTYKPLWVCMLKFVRIMHLIRRYENLSLFMVSDRRLQMYWIRMPCNRSNVLKPIVHYNARISLMSLGMQDLTVIWAGRSFRRGKTLRKGRKSAAVLHRKWDLGLVRLTSRLSVHWRPLTRLRHNTWGQDRAHPDKWPYGHYICRWI